MTRPWTNHEVRDLKIWVAHCVANKFIAARLGRSERSVQDKCQQLDIRRRKKRVMAPKPPVVRPVPGVLINHAEVPAYYVLGWRFAGFEDRLFRFVWGGKGEPRRPRYESTHLAQQRDDLNAASILHGVANELEVA